MPKHTPQFGGSDLPTSEKKRQRKLARRGKSYVPNFRLLHQPAKRYSLADKPLNYDEYLKGPYWLNLRTEILATRKLCEGCASVHRLQLHHRYYYKNGKSVLYHERQHPDVLVVLCRDCHMTQHATWTAET